MNTENTSTDFLLLFSGYAWDKGLSPEDLQKAMARVMAWVDDLKEQGRMKGGQPLGDQRQILSKRKDKVIADGPYAESKEAVGGYLVLQARNFEEAVAIARTCPSLDYGSSIEVRPILEECPVMTRYRQQFATASA